MVNIAPGADYSRRIAHNPAAGPSARTTIAHCHPVTPATHGTS